MAISRYNKRWDIPADDPAGKAIHEGCHVSESGSHDWSASDVAIPQAIDTRWFEPIKQQGLIVAQGVPTAGRSRLEGFWLQRR